MTRTADERSVLQVAYDAQGNRTQVAIHLNDLIGDDNHRDVQHFQYDAMNRQTVVDAVDAGGTIVEGQGHRLSYDQVGNRISDTTIAPHIVQRPDGSFAVEVGETTQRYEYDAMNRLQTATTDGVLIDRRLYDAASRTLIDGPLVSLNPNYAATHAVSLGALGTPILGHGNRYDANGQLVEQTSFEYGHITTNTTYEYDAVGNVKTQVAWDPALPPTLRNVSITRNTVEAAEGYRQSSSVTTVYLPNGASTQQGGVGFGYDANGHLNFVGDSGQAREPNLRQHHFVNDLQGHALYAYYNNENTPENRVNEQRQLVVNGEVLGRYGAIADARSSPSFTLQSDFGFGYAPIGTASLQTPKTYAVAAGDTLQGIAKALYGDADLWYLIADANGLSSSADLRTGQILQIPAHVLSTNDIETFKPYDPSGFVGSTSASLVDLPMPADGAQCGAFGKVIVVVVVAVVTYFTNPVVGNIAGQIVGNAIGVQDGFSWKQVAAAAITWGVSEYVGPAVESAVGGATGNSVAAAAARAAVVNAASQGIGVVTGLQDKFDWRGVVASAAGAGVGEAIKGPAASVFGSSSAGQFATRLTTGLAAGYTTAVLRGGRVSVEMVAADAFGNALGASIAAANSSGDVLGDFIDQQLVAQSRRDLYGLSNGDNRLGFRVDGGSGVRFSNNTASRWSNQIDNGLASAANQPFAALAESPPRSGMVMTDGGWFNPYGLASVGADGSPTAQVMLPPINPLTVGGTVGGGYQATRPTGVGAPPGYDPRTEMPYGAPGFQIPERPFATSPPPLMGESRSWSDILLGGLPLPARVAGSVLDTLVFKSPSDILGSNLEAAGYTRPEGSAAHHIVPYGDQRARDIRSQLDDFGIDLNSADNGVFLPQVPGSTAPGAYHPSLNNKDYHAQLQRDFLGIDSASQARDVLEQIRNQLLNGTYPGAKPVPPKQ